jgi:hypothetical protein
MILPMRLWVAGKSTKKEKLKQLPTRVPEAWLEVLETAQYLNRYDSMQALVRHIVEDFVHATESQPAMRKALEARRQHQATVVRGLVKIADRSPE